MLPRSPYTLSLPPASLILSRHTCHDRPYRLSSSNSAAWHARRHRINASHRDYKYLQRPPPPTETPASGPRRARISKDAIGRPAGNEQQVYSSLRLVSRGEISRRLPLLAHGNKAIDTAALPLPLLSVPFCSKTDTSREPDSGQGTAKKKKKNGELAEVGPDVVATAHLRHSKNSAPPGTDSPREREGGRQRMACLPMLLPSRAPFIPAAGSPHTAARPAGCPLCCRWTWRGDGLLQLSAALVPSIGPTGIPSGPGFPFRLGRE
ncbi:hypothetical protein CDD83_6463 [Cordyceps sp. RAO-2017]|nr:hypothetical protein CDD83_6463 [Cordyceps sp. RAO-2017]